MADDIKPPMMPQTIPRAMGRELVGLPLVFEEVYRDHFDFVYRSAARLGGPGFDAEDAAQEVFLVVARRLHTFDGTSRVTTWLFGITLNVVRAQRRRARIRSLWEKKEADHERHVGPQIVSVDRAEVREAHRIAYEILDKIAPKKREVFILAELEGLGCDEIAQIVDAKVETVWSRLHYARTEFAERVERRMRGSA
jgi:RNA polymerase sigma-70 factor (ECF subfamily)